jgi:hypothetical protein
MVDLMVATESAPLIGIAAGAVVAALGYVGKLAIETWREWRKAEAQTLAQLVRLQALLRAGRTAFVVQRELAGRLAAQVRKNHANDLPETVGLERLFSQMRATFTPDERELHEVIRAYSEQAIYPLNEALAEWLQGDVRYRIVTRRTSEREIRLAELLNVLDAHLLLWRAKYQRWIPDQPDHALVYLDDEESHGLGFPQGLDVAVEAVLAERRRRRRRH